MRNRCVRLVMWTSCVVACSRLALAATLYVDKNNATPAEPYDSPANAATSIQTAINYASAGATIMVYAATYDVGETHVYGCSNRVYISKAVSVRSVGNDPVNTIIKGAWDPTTTNGPAAVRCVFMIDTASLIGFTLTNGATVTTNDYRSNCGGGVYVAGSSGTVSNCIITGNTAYGDGPNGVGGGGVTYGTFRNCQIVGNRVGPGRILGGGAFDSKLYNCLIAGNVAEQGGGAFRCTLYGCTVSNNTATKITGTYSLGGGICGWSAAMPCRAYDCTITANQADRGGGASDYCILSNCTVSLNSVPATIGQQGYGGGDYRSTLVNCRVVSNRSTFIGGGGYGGYYTNCTFAYNDPSSLHGPGMVYNCLIYGSPCGVYLSAGSILDGCTIAGNTYGVYDYYASGSIHVRNCVVYTNAYNWEMKSNVFVFTNTCTTPAYAGWAAGNITNDPRFIAYGNGFSTNHVAGNYRLRYGSPCLNAATNQSWMIGQQDLDGNPRLDTAFGIADMGCYEFAYTRGTTFGIR